VRQAVILAGGQGSRLKPYTDTRPKPMIEIAGQCIIDHQIQWLAESGVTEVVVSAGHLHQVLIEHLTSTAQPLRARTVVERMYVSVHTVAFHLRHIFRKLSIRSRLELARLAIERANATTSGLITTTLDGLSAGARVRPGGRQPTEFAIARTLCASSTALPFVPAVMRMASGRQEE
jgi:NDP-sugar pyrophosphorylase family protein